MPIATILITFVFLVFLLYSILILFFGYFFSLKSENNNKKNISTEKLTASIIIPARNEADTICLLLNDLAKQTYPKDLYEIIVLDDESTDNTVEIVYQFIKREKSINCQLIKITDKVPSKIYGYFKKKAISYGIKHAKGDIIMTSDADCRLGEKWIESFIEIFKKTDIKMATGMVAFKDDKSHFEKAQHLEFLSLIASSVASVKMGIPIMCNGANLAYRKDVFEEVDGYKSDIDFASGDDIFLLLKIKKKYGAKSIFCNQNQNSIVYTKAKKTIRDFINQRIRWASKTKGYRDFYILLVAAIVFFMNLSLMIFFLLSFYSLNYFKTFIALILLKNIVDIPVLLSATNYVNRKDLRKYIIPMNFIYFIYFNLTGIIGSLVNYKWKGRVIRK